MSLCFGLPIPRLQYTSPGRFEKSLFVFRWFSESTHFMRNVTYIYIYVHIYRVQILPNIKHEKKSTENMSPEEATLD